MRSFQQSRVVVDWSYLAEFPPVGLFAGRRVYAGIMQGQRRKVPVGQGEKEGSRTKCVYLRATLNSLPCHPPLPHHWE